MANKHVARRLANNQESSTQLFFNVNENCFELKRWMYLFAINSMVFYTFTLVRIFSNLLPQSENLLLNLR